MSREGAGGITYIRDHIHVHDMVSKAVKSAATAASPNKNTDLRIRSPLDLNWLDTDMLSTTALSRSLKWLFIGVFYKRGKKKKHLAPIVPTWSPIGLTRLLRLLKQTPGHGRVPGFFSLFEGPSGVIYSTRDMV